MKKEYVILAIFAALLWKTYAQTERERQRIISNYDLERSAEIKNNFEQENLERLVRIENYVNSLSPEERAGIDMSKLSDVLPDGTPIYVVSHNFGSARTIRANQLHPGGSTGLDLTGVNMIAGLWEAQNGYPLTSHNDLAGRVNIIDGGVNVNFHATHVAGTIMSSGASTFDNIGKGIAFEASVNAANSDNDESEMTDQAAQGLLVSNHSYGLSANGLPEWIFGAYNAEASGVDLITFNHPYYLPVKSAGNDRDDFPDYNPTKGGYDLLTGMSNSKNTITSAAVENVANYTGPSSVDMSSFSNYGPTDDGRIKPDISSQGVNVNSTSNASDTSYSNANGTSMSAPAISGLLLLLQEHFNNVNSTYMLASTAKGLLLHTADEAGIFQGPDYAFGWGLANGERAALTISDAFVENNSVIEEATLLNSETRTFSVIATGDEPLMVSICWTDPPGFPVFDDLDNRNPVLVNDLDIKLTSGGTDYYPWKLDPLNPALAATRNSTNDVDIMEKIEVDSPLVNQSFDVTISHKGSLAGGSQGYSLIITGGNIEKLSLGENLKVNDLSVFPNPSSGEMTLKLSSNFTDDIDVSIIDLQGRIVYQSTSRVTDKVFQKPIDISGVASGIYFVRIKQNRFELTERIVIE
jgi:hypothetical protein